MTDANPTVRFVTYNTQYCTGLDGRTDVQRIVDAVHGADVICLQEIDRFWKRTGYADQAAAITESFPDHYWTYGAAMDVDASYRGDSGRLVNRRRQFGNMVLARWPLLMVRNHLLPKLHLRTPMSLQRAALETVVDLPDGPCRVVSVHLAHAAASERHLQIERLLSILHHAPNDGGAWSGRAIPQGWDLDGPPQAQPARTIVMGDFNIVPESSEYARICGLVDPAHGSLSTVVDFLDLWAVAKNTNDDGATHHGQEGSKRLDYAFVTGELAERLSRIWVEQSATGSDHKPLWVELSLT